MALSAAFEKLVNLIQDPAEREETRKRLLENEENGLRQQEFSRKMNDLSAKEKRWLEWHGQADKQFKEAVQEAKQLRQKVDDLSRAQSQSNGGEPDLSGSDAALAKALRDAKSQLEAANARTSKLEETLTGINRMFEEGKILTQEKFEEEATRKLDQVGAAMFDILDKQNQCIKEYGVPLDRNQLLVKAQELGGNLDRAFEIITAPLKEAKLRKDIEAEYEKKFQERLKTSNLPIDQGASGEPVLGPLQQRIYKKDTGIPDDVQADGSGRLANLIAAELRAEGKY